MTSHRVLLVLLSFLGCGKPLAKVVAENRPALDAQREKFLKAAAAVTTGARPAECTLPKDLVHHETVELMHESAAEEIDTEDSKTNHVTVKLDPHQSDLRLARAGASPKRPPMRGKPFPYSLLGDDAASEGSIRAIERAKGIKYVVFTRISERDDTAGVVKAEAVVTSLADAKVLCVVSAEGKADPQNEGQVRELVKVEKKTGKQLGVVRTDIVGDYEDKVTTAVANDLKLKLEKTLGFDAWAR